MDPHKEDVDLPVELRALRPRPRPEFVAELDARAAAGFRGTPPRHVASPLARVRQRLRFTPPRRLLAPAGALAALAIAVTTVVVAVPERAGDRNAAAPLAEGGRGAEGSGRSVQFSQSPPVMPGSSGGSSAASANSAADVERAPGPYASRAQRREVERSAEIVLLAEPDDVRAAAAEVFDAVHAVDGIVLRSTVRDGAAGEAGAEFELLVPSGRLGDAMASFSAVAEVRSRREGTEDITAPTVSARESLQDARATIESLLRELAEADTEGERVAAEAELRAERRRAAVLRSRLSSLQRRSNFSRVSLRIESGSGSASEEGGAWGIGDAFDDAGRILAVAAGVTLVALAVPAPLAGLALLAWLANRAWLRRRRERALA